MSRDEILKKALDNVPPHLRAQIEAHPEQVHLEPMCFECSKIPMSERIMKDHLNQKARQEGYEPREQKPVLH